MKVASGPASATSFSIANRATGSPACRSPLLGDVFFDLEGDAFVGDMGWSTSSATRCSKMAPRVPGGVGPDRPKGAGRLRDVRRHGDRTAGQRYPDFHIYHYAPYEPSALHRLMGRYGTREEEVDRLLRGGRFVDLYAVVRHAVRASVESYSIKGLEPFFGYERDVACATASRNLQAIEYALEFGRRTDFARDARSRCGLQPRRLPRHAPPAKLARIAADGLVRDGVEVARPANASGEASEEVDVAVSEGAALETARARHPRGPRRPHRGSAGAVDSRPASRVAPARGQGGVVGVLPAVALSERSSWTSASRSPGSSSWSDVGAGGTVRVSVDRYRFPPQETEIVGDKPKRLGERSRFGRGGLDPASRTIDIKKGPRRRCPSGARSSSTTWSRPTKCGMRSARVGEWAAENGIERAGTVSAGRDLLLARPPPRLRTAPITVGESGETRSMPPEGGCRSGRSGPADPGAAGLGQDVRGAQMICAVVRGGRRSGSRPSVTR